MIAMSEGDAGADRDILGHRQLAEEPDVLAGARDPSPSDFVKNGGELIRADLDAAGCRGEHTGEEVQHRRLACPVRPDQPNDLTGAEVERDAGHGEYAAELLLELLGVEDGAAHRSRSACRGYVPAAQPNRCKQAPPSGRPIAVPLRRHPRRTRR